MRVWMWIANAPWRVFAFAFGLRAYKQSKEWQDLEESVKFARKRGLVPPDLLIERNVVRKSALIEYAKLIAAHVVAFILLLLWLKF